MKLSSFKQIALGSVFALTLVGCASAPPPEKKDATALSLDTDKSDANKSASKDKPDMIVAKPATDLNSAIAQAQAQRKNGDLTGAAHTLSQLVLASPDDPRVLGEYGKTLVAQGRTDDALAFLERALELQPADWTLYSAQGVAYDQKGNYPAAQGSYQRALALKPAEPAVLSNAALSRVQSGDLDGAERLLLQAVPGGTDYPRIANNLALVRSLKAERANAAAANAKPAAPVTASAAPATATAPVPPPVVTPRPKVDTATLAAPTAQAASASAPIPPAKLSGPPPVSSGLAALQKDPSVRVQALPKDDQANSKTADAKTPAKPQPKAMAQKKTPDGTKTADTNTPQTAMLRASLSDEDRP